MVVSCFGPYHHLVHNDAPLEHAGVILTPWTIPLALGLGAILLGVDWHLVPSPPCICRFLWWARNATPLPLPAQHVQTFSDARNYSLTCWVAACIELTWIWMIMMMKYWTVSCHAVVARCTLGEFGRDFGNLLDDVGWQCSLNSLTINSYKGSGGNEKLPPHRFPTVGILQEFHQTTTQFPPQTSSPWCSVCPSYGVDSMNRPNPMRGPSSTGVGQGLLGGVLYKSIKKTEKLI